MNPLSLIKKVALRFNETNPFITLCQCKCISSETDTELRHPYFSAQEPLYFCSLSLCLLFGEWNPFLSMTPRDLPTVPSQLRALLLWEQQAPLSPQLHQAVHTTDHPLTPDPSTLARYAQSGTHTMGPVTAFTHLKNLRFILIR